MILYEACNYLPGFLDTT